MPATESLPDDLKELAKRNAIELTHNNFARDVADLFEALSDAIRLTTEEEKRIINWMADKFQQEHEIDLREDSESFQRLKNAAIKVKDELADSFTANISLPFITTDENSAPKQLDITLNRDEIQQLVSESVEQTSPPSVDPQTATGTLILHRPRAWGNASVKYKMFIDNEPVHNIANGETISITLPAGQHTMHSAHWLGSKSNTVTFDLEENVEIKFQVTYKMSKLGKIVIERVD